MDKMQDEINKQMLLMLRNLLDVARTVIDPKDERIDKCEIALYHLESLCEE